MSDGVTVSLHFEPYDEPKRWQDKAGNSYVGRGDVVVTCSEHGEIIRFMTTSYLAEEHPHVEGNACLWRDNHMRDEHGTEKRRRVVVDADGREIRPGDHVRFPADIMSYTEPTPFTFAGLDPDDSRMVFITDLETGQRGRVAPSVIGGRIVEAGEQA